MKYKSEVEAKLNEAASEVNARAAEFQSNCGGGKSEDGGLNEDPAEG